MPQIRLFENAILSSPVDADILFTANSTSTPLWEETQTTFSQVASYLLTKLAVNFVPETITANQVLLSTNNNPAVWSSTIPSGTTWNGNLITGQFGGTGVANTGKTITIGGNLTFSGGFTFVATLTNNTSVTFPTSGTIATDSFLDVTGTSQTLIPSTTHFANNASLVTFLLPSSLSEGQWFRVQGKGAGGWIVTQNSGQQIAWSSTVSTTSGISGSLASTDQYDSILIFVLSSTACVVSQAKGNITVT